MTRNRSTRLTVNALEARDVPSSTNYFDSSWYLSRNPDVAAAVQSGQMTAETHFRKWGDAERRSGNRLFDANSYLDDNPDVKSAALAGKTTAQRHFELYGQFENRSANRTFAPHDYLDDNPDVRHASQTGQMTAFEHFLRHGQFEDRLPSHGFDRTTYLDDNPDVRNAVNAGHISAVAHYELYGRHEGRRLATATPVSTPVGQATTFTGVSQNHSDKKFFSFTPPANGTLTVVVTTSNGVFAAVEVENALNSIDVLETNPNNGVNTASGAVLQGVPYLLRVRAPQNSPANFTVQVTLS